MAKPPSPSAPNTAGSARGLNPAAEWQYYIEGQARTGVFAAHDQARTFDFSAGDVGFIPFAVGHYIQNTGDTPLRFLEVFKSSYYADVSLNQWLALTPPELVKGHMGFDDSVMTPWRSVAPRRPSSDAASIAQTFQTCSGLVQSTGSFIAAARFFATASMMARPFSGVAARGSPFTPVRGARSAKL